MVSKVKSSLPALCGSSPGTSDSSHTVKDNPTGLTGVECECGRLAVSLCGPAINLSRVQPVISQRQANGLCI